MSDAPMGGRGCATWRRVSLATWSSGSSATVPCRKTSLQPSRDRRVVRRQLLMLLRARMMRRQAEEMEMEGLWRNSRLTSPAAAHAAMTTHTGALILGVHFFFQSLSCYCATKRTNWLTNYLDSHYFPAANRLDYRLCGQCTKQSLIFSPSLSLYLTQSGNG